MSTASCIAIDKAGEQLTKNATLLPDNVTVSKNSSGNKKSVDYPCMWAESKAILY